MNTFEKVFGRNGETDYVSQVNNLKTTNISRVK